MIHKLRVSLLQTRQRTHGRIQILNEESAKESTGHGSPHHNWYMVGLVAQGGGEELGGFTSGETLHAANRCSG